MKLPTKVGPGRKIALQTIYAAYGPVLFALYSAIAWALKVAFVVIWAGFGHRSLVNLNKLIEKE